MLAHVVRHNNWANATLLEFCREVERRTVDELRTIARATGDRLCGSSKARTPTAGSK